MLQGLHGRAAGLAMPGGIARLVRPLLALALAALAWAGPAGGAAAQTYGIATMQPGTLNHTTGSAIAKVLKEKGGLNVLVQPTAGEITLIPMVARAEADLGIANIAEVMKVMQGLGGAVPQPDLRLVGSIHALRVALFVRKDSPMKSVADLKGMRVTVGYSAMRTLDTIVQAMLAAGGLAQKDIVPVPVPSVVRGADEFLAGTADTFMFAFGAAKVREVDASVGGLRALEIPEQGMEASRKLYPYAYLTEVGPGPVFVGVPQKMKVYSYDNMLFTNAKVKDEIVYRIIDTLEKHKSDLVAVQPALREFSAAGLHKKYDIAYHGGALRYFKEHNLEAKAAK